MRKIFLILFLVLFFVIISIYSYVNAVSSDISSSVIRLHVIANSNSFEDQELKYKVRDSLLDYMNTINFNVSSKEEAEHNVLLHIEDFNSIAKDTIISNGFSYDTKVEFSNTFFPTKEYNNVVFPAGLYDSLKVIIGDGNGQNWWCVMFPPLCFVDTTSSKLSDESFEYLNETLTDEEIDLISQDSPSYEFKFKIIEIFNSLLNKE